MKAVEIKLVSFKNYLNKQIAKAERDYHECLGLCEEDMRYLCPGLSYNLYCLRTILRDVTFHPWKFIEKNLEEMQHTRDLRRYLRKQDDINSFDYKNDSDGYGVITFWDGNKDIFFTSLGKIYFVRSKECYPLYQFQGEHCDCSLHYIKA